MSEPRVLICGSIAFDTIMVFEDRFRNHILPEKTHMLNVAFTVLEMRREFGGCAGNIGYNLKLLGGAPVVMASIGDDGQPYRARLAGFGIDDAHVHTMPGTFTAQAFITTDLDDNQITAFHPGAMGLSHRIGVGEAAAVRLGIIAPDGRDGMLAHAAQLHAAGIPFIFDPGQAMPLFNGDELRRLVDWADYLAVNDYEGELLQERTGMSRAELAGKVKAMIVTLGADGSRIVAGEEAYEIPAVRPKDVVDPTGCGDAYRAGLLYGIAHGWDWLRTGRLASLLGSIKVEHRGGQNHHFDRASVAARYRDAFGAALW
ncbi:MAG: carbohydrate kinase family protein [Betaproteobacteria bacterium]|nr:carbohydrate kinase family protein [Betaproteobacteria bacterium]